MKALKKETAPTMVLMIVCIIVTLTLTFTYQVTKPVIAANAKANADAARARVLPAGGGGYSPVDCALSDGVLEVYAADNGSGYVITAKDKGFAGDIVVIVGFGSDRKIQGIKVLEHTETPGLGSVAMSDTHMSQFLGKEKITNTNETDADYIDAVTGATISSNAVFRAVNKALEQYDELGEADDE